ncbi:MAG TPA: methyltransferase domain-containing protein [Ktedonobacterales bacterium]|nr:methyltransferase domain-containing protein [Ktedonobacterales bacterium]
MDDERSDDRAAPLDAGPDTYIGRDDPGEAERLRRQRAGDADELARALAGCALPPAPRVLEVGCGAGAFTAALLSALPDARIIALDRNPDLLAAAARALGDAAAPGGRVALLRGDAARLPFATRAFDLVACRCVLMHQTDPMQAVAEMHRVADTGGYALAIEPDWGARALYPDGEALAALLDLARRGRRHGFPDVMIGRQLFALFRAAGFAPVRVLATSFLATADDVTTVAAETEAGASAGPERLLEQGRGLLRAAGLATDADLDHLIARLAAIPRSQDYCSLGVDLAVIGAKPAPPLLP